MKIRHFGVMILLWLSATAGNTAENDSLLYADITGRSMLKEEFSRSYRRLSSLLSVWNLPDYSYLSGGYLSAKGEYTHPQLLFSRNLLNIRTESVKTFHEKGWRFFGAVEYQNGNAETGRWNMSYYLPENGSPYYYMIEQPGTWKTQSYDFNVAIQKSISHKLSLGLKLNYLGDLTFRTFDTRNDNTTLDIAVIPSATLTLGSYHFLSLGLSFNRKKNESYIYNKYQHGPEEEKYHLFLNQGMGTWDNAPTTMRMVFPEYGTIIGWTKIKQKHKIQAEYAVRLGKENWKLKSLSTLLNRKEDINSYSCLSQELVFDHSAYRGSGTWKSRLHIQDIYGTGSVFRDKVNVFQENYQQNRLNSQVQVSFLRYRSLLRKISGSIDFENCRQNDFNYGHKLNYSNLTGSVLADFSLFQIRKTGIILGGSGSWKRNLGGNHTPRAAAGNFYTPAIAVPVFTYVTSDYLQAGLNCAADYHMPGRQILEFRITGDFIQPVKIRNYVQGSLFSTKDHYTTISISLCFNF